MMSRFSTLALGTGLVLAGFAALPMNSVQANASGPLQCQIHVGKNAAGVVLKGVATAKTAASGSYTFNLVKDGSAGSSEIRQAGGFSLRAGGSSTLSEVNVSLEAGASYDAILTVTWAGGTITCRQVLPAGI